ncbi:MAG: cupin domain-containing protein [Cyclonatronaceae bacterium]
MIKNADYWIHALGLTAHPEGGYYREIYRSRETIDKKGLPERYNGDRHFSTSIYFLLKGHENSRLHRLKSDETWHFYEGSALTLFVLSPFGRLRRHVLGSNLERGEQFQLTVPADHWFGASVNDPVSFTLVGCTVAPGFDFEDFEMAELRRLVSEFPQHRAFIEQLC